jgi:hypothetical protein
MTAPLQTSTLFVRPDLSLMIQQGDDMLEVQLAVEDAERLGRELLLRAQLFVEQRRGLEPYAAVAPEALRDAAGALLRLAQVAEFAARPPAPEVPQ